MFPSDCFLELSVVKQEADIAASEAAVLNPMLVANSEHICTRFPLRLSADIDISIRFDERTDAAGAVDQ